MNQSSSTTSFPAARPLQSIKSLILGSPRAPIGARRNRQQQQKDRFNTELGKSPELNKEENTGEYDDFNRKSSEVSSCELVVTSVPGDEEALNAENSNTDLNKSKSKKTKNNTNRWFPYRSQNQFLHCAHLSGDDDDDEPDDDDEEEEAVATEGVESEDEDETSSQGLHMAPRDRTISTGANSSCDVDISQSTLPTECGYVSDPDYSLEPGGGGVSEPLCVSEDEQEEVKLHELYETDSDSEDETQQDLLSNVSDHHSPCSRTDNNNVALVSENPTAKSPGPVTGTVWVQSPRAGAKLHLELQLWSPVAISNSSHHNSGSSSAGSSHDERNSKNKKSKGHSEKASSPQLCVVPSLSPPSSPVSSAAPAVLLSPSRRSSNTSKQSPRRRSIMMSDSAAPVQEVNEEKMEGQDPKGISISPASSGIHDTKDSNCVITPCSESNQKDENEDEEKDHVDSPDSVLSHTPPPPSDLKIRDDGETEGMVDDSVNRSSNNPKKREPGASPKSLPPSPLSHNKLEEKIKKSNDVLNSNNSSSCITTNRRKSSSSSSSRRSSRKNDKDAAVTSSHASFPELPMAVALDEDDEDEPEVLPPSPCTFTANSTDRRSSTSGTCTSPKSTSHRKKSSSSNTSHSHVGSSNTSSSTKKKASHRRNSKSAGDVVSSKPTPVIVEECGNEVPLPESPSSSGTKTIVRQHEENNAEVAEGCVAGSPASKHNNKKSNGHQRSSTHRRKVDRATITEI